MPNVSIFLKGNNDPIVLQSFPDDDIRALIDDIKLGATNPIEFVLNPYEKEKEVVILINPIEVAAIIKLPEEKKSTTKPGNLGLL